MIIWRRWVRFWSEKESGFSIAMVRISIGITLLYTCLSPYISGVWQAIWVDEVHGGIRHYKKVPWLLDLLGGATTSAVETMLWMGIVASIGLIIGFAGRLSALTGMIVMNTISWHNPLATGGHDDLIANALWLLVFVQNDCTLSVSCKVRTGRWQSNTQVYSIVRRLLLTQLIIMYASTGLQKVSAHWVPFGEMDAIWYILQQPTWSWRDHQFLAPWFWVTQLGTLGTWMFEVCSPVMWIFMLWESNSDDHWYQPAWGQRFVRRCKPRTVFACVGIPMHLGILFTMDVGPFSYAALSYYWALYVPIRIMESAETQSDQSALSTP